MSIVGNRRLVIPGLKGQSKEEQKFKVNAGYLCNSKVTSATMKSFFFFFLWQGITFTSSFPGIHYIGLLGTNRDLPASVSQLLKLCHHAWPKISAKKKKNVFFSFILVFRDGVNHDIEIATIKRKETQS